MSKKEFLSLEEKHRSAVAEYFSTKTEFWNVIYAEKHNATGRSLIQKESMKFRKFMTLTFIDLYAKKEERFLDVGCGTGVLAMELAKKGLNVSAVDIAEGMINNLRQKVEMEKINLQCFQAPVEELPFDNENIGTITCLGVVEYLPDVKLGLLEMNRVLMKNGILILSIPNLLKMNNLLDPYRLFKRGMKYFFPKKKSIDLLDELSTNENFLNKRFKLNEFLKLADECNFKLMDMESIGYGPFTFFGKNIFNDERSIKLNYKLGRFSHRVPFTFLKYFCNRWVLCLKKNI